MMLLIQTRSCVVRYSMGLLHPRFWKISGAKRTSAGIGYPSGRPPVNNGTDGFTSAKPSVCSQGRMCRLLPSFGGRLVLRLRMTMMTHKAGCLLVQDLLMGVEIVGHYDHFPCHVFHRLIVLLKSGVIRIDDMAEITADAERVADLMHIRPQPFGGHILQYLDVFEFLLGGLRLGRVVLSDAQSAQQQRRQHTYCRQYDTSSGLSQRGSPFKSGKSDQCTTTSRRLPASRVSGVANVRIRSPEGSRATWQPTGFGPRLTWTSEALGTTCAPVGKPATRRERRVNLAPPILPSDLCIGSASVNAMTRSIRRVRTAPCAVGLNSSFPQKVGAKTGHVRVRQVPGI